MFDIQFESEYKAIACYDSENKLRFDPPVYEQRYSAVLRCLQLHRWSRHFKKIVEFGCAEMRLLVFLKSLPGVEEILQVDIDENLLQRNKYKAQPLVCDYLRERETQLKVDIYCGSIDTPNDCLLNTDVVIGVEIIEHLYPDTIENVPYNIFGFMKPKIAIFTTPNAEYNVLFNMTAQFRHDDHKFEWTREQFEDWGHNICTRFPEYKVAFYGIGPGPENACHLGCCTQMALFVRDDFLQLTSSDIEDIEVYDNKEMVKDCAYDTKTFVANDVNLMNNASNERRLSDDVIMEAITENLATTHIDKENYRLIVSYMYPRNMDDRDREQKIFDEARFHLSRYMNLDDDHYDSVNDMIQVPVQNIFNLCYKVTTDIDEFRCVMRTNNYVIDENDVFQIKPYESESESDDYEGDYYTLCWPTEPGRVAESEEDWD